MMKRLWGALASVLLIQVAAANDVVSREDAFSVGRVVIPGNGAVEVALDRADATYACGHEVAFTVTVNETNAVAKTAGKVRWELDNYGAHVFASGTADLAAANPFVVKGTLPYPGFLRLTVYPEKGKKPLRRYSAAFEPEKIRTAVPKPDDFDAFWDGAVAKLEREVPLDLRLEDLPEFVTKKGERMRRISCATVGGKRVYGVLLTPPGADKGRKFPVCVQCPGAGSGYSLKFCWGRRRPDRVILFMSLHGFPLPADEAATKEPYEAQEAAWREVHGKNSARAYPVGGLTVSREAGHYYDKILGINRVVSWLAAQPFVDPTRFFYSGASQGGAMGLILGGLNPNFSRIYAGVPALTDVLSCKADGRQSGWPRITEYETQKDPERLARIQSNARYFDAAYFAERITAPIRLSVGYIDESCAPHAVCAAYNGIPAKDKRIYHGIGGHHGARNAPMDEVEAWLMSRHAELKTPETSSLFVRYEDPESHVVSYLLRPKSFAWNQQSIYFTTKSMTDDGRFLVFDYADDEFRGKRVQKHKAVVDFRTDTIVALPGTTGNIPYLDTATDRLYYTSPEGVWRHDLLVSPTNRTLVCPWPQAFLDLAKRFGEKRGHLATHPTLTQDKRKMFIDSRYGDTFFHGMLDLEKGAWEHWGETPFFMNHGQVCPSEDNLAMGAWEVDWVDSKGEHHPIHNIGPDKRYPRMWYLKPGNVREMIDPGPAMNYATHEMWDEDGHGHYWNNWTGLWHYDRFTKETSRLSPFPAGHSVVSRDMRYQVSDFPVGWGYWRGNFWNVVFRDGQTGGAVFIHTFNDALCPPTNQSKLHPDTHPCFVMGERYILTTLCSADGHMDLCLTPTAPLRALCAKPTPLGTPLPASAHPIDVGERIGQQYFRATSEDRFRRGKSPELFAAIMEYARLTGNHRLPYDNDGLRYRAQTADAARAKNKIPYAPDPAAVEAVSLIRAVLAGDASKRDAARAAWTKVASPETPQDWRTVMEGVNLLVAADTPVTSVPLRVLTPVPGETVSLTTPGRREFLGWSAEERRKKFLDRDWRRTAAQKVKSEPAPVTLRWYGDMPEEGFRVIVRRKGVEKPVVDQVVRENRLELWNLEVARTYTWTVRAGRKYVTASFDTQDLAPRDMKVRGVPNFRDLGGWKTVDGRRVKQGLVYRSQGLNDNANYYLGSKETMALYKAGRLEELYGKLGKEIKERIDAEGGTDDFDYGNAPWMRKSLPRKDPKPPRARLDEPTKAYLLDTLGIRSDIDLRGPNEVWGMTESPLGPRAKWFWIPNFAYGGMGQEVGKDGFRKVFKVFLDEANYPIVFHCIGGADRTGCDAWILNGLLGVAEDDLMKDWELTCFTYEHHSFGHATRIEHFLKLLDKVPGATMKEKCENYVKTLGFTDDDIAKFRAIMLEDGDPFANLPAEAAPEKIGRRVIDQLLRTRPDNYDPPGYTGKPYGQCITLTYSVASLWANAIRFAAAQRDEALVKRLTDDFEPYFPGGARAKSCHTPYHVDDNIVGVVPYAVYRVTRDPRAVKMGDLYADTQWAAPCEAVYTKYHALPRAKIDELWAKGYSPLTRLWIDDMYMIIALQEEAARIHRDRTYLDRAAHEMCLYLDELQIKDGPTKGLFYHAPDTPFIWGRGCGWMAAGMALVLAQHPDEPDRAKIMDGYRAMMAALLRYQREDGLWGQLVNEPTSWGESSGTAMFTYAFVVGVRNGWLDPKTYGAAARKAYLKLCSSLDAYGNVPSVCIGTGKKNDHQYYLDRERITGDSHGQAPLLWTVNALLGVE